MSQQRFLDVKPPRQRPGADIGPPPRPRTPGSQLPPAQNRPPVANMPPKPQPKPIAAPPQAPQQPGRPQISSPRTTFTNLLKPTTFFYALAAISLGALATNQVIGEALILLYGIYALVRRLPSRTSFSLTFIAFAFVPIALLLSNARMAHAFASYAFLLLFFATIALLREQMKTH